MPAARVEPARWEELRPMLLAGIRRHHAFAEAARTIPAQWEEFRRRYAVFVHRGAAAGIQGTWGAIMDDWLPRSGYVTANQPDFERYDSRYDVRTESGEVEIWVGVRRESLPGTGQPALSS